MTKPKLNSFNIARQIMWIHRMHENVRNMTAVCLLVSLRLISLCEFAPKWAKIKGSH